jgi:hypothetical protein
VSNPHESPRRGRALKKILLLLLGLFVFAQVLRPDRKNPPYEPAHAFDAVLKPSVEIQTLIRDACSDCHTRETRWPWYSHVSPVSWLVAGHVKEGREHLDFSIFGALSRDDQRKMLHECAEEVEEAHMPLPVYTWLHSRARLSTEQRQRLAAWFQAKSDELK